jgi:hypothetical protein
MKKYLKLMTVAAIAGLKNVTTACTADDLQDVMTLATAGGGVPVFWGENLETIEADYGEGYFWEAIDMPEFIKFTGRITEIRPFYDYIEDSEFVTEDKLFVTVESFDYEPITINFIVNDNTVRIWDGELEIDMVVTAFHESSMPAPLIYPAQHNARVFTSEAAVYVSRFDENWSSFDIPLVINITDETEIIFEDGEVFEGDIEELHGRALATIIYMFATPYRNAEDWRSLATPSKVIILFERAVHPILYLTEEEIAMIDNLFTEDTIENPASDWGGGLLLTPEDLEILWDNMIDPETVQVIVNGEVIDTPTPFVNREAGFVMVPVGHIARALGMDVLGEGEEIMIGRGIHFEIGVDYYFFGRRAPQQLGAAPELHDGVIFVPLHFFGQIVPAVAYLDYGNVVIYDTDLN